MKSKPLTPAERQKAYRDRKRLAKLAAENPGAVVTQIGRSGGAGLGSISLEATLTALIPSAGDDPLAQGFMALAVMLAREVDNPRGVSSAAAVAQIEKLLEKALPKGRRSDDRGAGGLAGIVGTR